MSTVHRGHKDAVWLSHVMTTDFCPWANRYVYWLKEPVGWFVLATLASVLVGMFLSPIGWTLAVGLVSLIAIGLVFPWLATRCVRCRLRPVEESVSECGETAVELAVKNYLPAPLTGLVLRGFFDGHCRTRDSELHAVAPDIVLARVPALSSVTYRLPVTPEYRGVYPAQSPVLACAFPFVIWTARRTVREFETVTVLPLVGPIV